MEKDPDFAVVLLSGGLWRTPSVCEQPAITLVRWRVIEVEEKDGTNQRHFVGYNADDFEGRVSTAIEQFSAETAQGVTRSGRVYQLVGPAGYDADAEYVWQRWASLNKVTSQRDVSAEIEQLIAEASPHSICALRPEE